MDNALDRLLTSSDLIQYAFRDPRIKAYAMQPRQNETVTQPRPGTGLSEDMAVADPFAVSALARLLGMAPAGNVLVNESHGLANQDRRQRTYGMR